MRWMKPGLAACGVLLLLTLACAGETEVVKESPSVDGVVLVEGAFLPGEWEHLVWDAGTDPLEGAVASRPVRRMPGVGPVRRPPLLTPRLSPAQTQARQLHAANLAAEQQARQLYRPHPDQLQNILIRVYSDYPIPQLVGITP